MYIVYNGRISANEINMTGNSELMMSALERMMRMKIVEDVDRDDDGDDVDVDVKAT